MMPPQHERMALLKELEENNAFFDELVDMIPAKLYVAGNSGDDAYNPKYYKGQHKESKEARRARSKAAKRAKFDPEQAETTTQVKERLAREEGLELQDLPATPSLVSAPPTPATTPTNTSSTTTSTPSSASRIEALRAKLHAKLAEKRGQRPSDPNVVSKRAARRAEKQRRQEEAKAKKQRALSQVKDASKKNYTLKTATTSSSQDASADLATMDFGKLAGLNATPKNFINNKSLAHLSGQKKKQSLEKLLKDAEEKRQKLEEFKKSGDTQKADKLLWSDALKEASGDRVKDNPAKLKKAIQKKQAQKKKSQKAWKSRMEQTQEKMQERQKIRSHNLEKRRVGGAVGANLSNKRIVDETDQTDKEKGSRRLSRAGFEGKKQDFLNPKDKGNKGKRQ